MAVVKNFFSHVAWVKSERTNADAAGNDAVKETEQTAELITQTRFVRVINPRVDLITAAQLLTFMSKSLPSVHLHL